MKKALREEGFSVKGRPFLLARILNPVRSVYVVDATAIDARIDPDSSAWRAA
jgi:hypothetical protein